MDVTTLLTESVLPETRFFFRVADEAPGTVVFSNFIERIDDTYEAELILATPTPGYGPEKWLGQSSLLEVQRGGITRRFQGIVRRVEDLGNSTTHRYARLVIVPSLWLLSQRVDSRIFQEMPVVAIVKQVLREAGVYQGTKLVASGALDGLAPREYCVQYRESDLDFVKRLLQEEGIAFWFTHNDEDGETLVLADEPARFDTIATLDGAAVTLATGHAGVEKVETLRWMDLRGSLESTGEVLREYDFTRPSATMHMTPAAPSQGGARTVYDYPARFHVYNYSDGSNTYEAHDGVRQARIRHEMRQDPIWVAAGASNLTGMLPGHAVQVHGHQHPHGDGRWLVTEVRHTLQGWSALPEDVRNSDRLREALAHTVQAHAKDGTYSERYINHFRMTPASMPWRPARVTPRPLIYGTQTALVTGPSGEEIHVDFHGRIKVQFHWDRVGKKNDKSSCWIRTAQNWSGGTWGFQFIPRIGMEVVVTFLEGDPDRPLITGCVYNGENHNPYGLPGEKTRSAIRTQTTPGGGGYNELRFEDKKEQEEVYLRAQKDLNEWVLHDHGSQVDNDQTLTVNRHRIKTIKGNERIRVEKNRSANIQQNDTLEVDQNRDVSVHGSRGYSVQVDKTYYLRADGRIILECGSSSIIMTPDSITLHSPKVKIEGEQETVILGGVVKIN